MTAAPFKTTTDADRGAILNRLLQIHFRSLPMYLATSHPWAARGHEKGVETLTAIAADQRRTVERISEELLAEGLEIDPGEFPMLYTDMHDLSVDYILKALVEEQRRDVAEIEGCAKSLGGDSLVQETLGAAKGHLETLEELVAEPAGA